MRDDRRPGGEDPAIRATGAPLWHGRFADGPERRRSWRSRRACRSTGAWPPTTSTGSRAHVAHARDASACSTDDEVGADPRARSTRSRRELDDGDVRVRSRPTRTSTPPSSAASPSSPARPGRSCTPGGAATTRSRPTCASGSAARAAAVAARDRTTLQSVLLARAEDAGDDVVPAGLHAPPAGAAGAARAPPARALLGARARRRPVAGRAGPRPTCRRSARARSPGSSLPLDPDGDRRATLGFAAPFENSLDAVSDRDFVAEALFVRRARAGAPVAPRRGDRARGRATSSASSGSPTRTAPARRCCRRRGTPTSPSSRAGKAGRVIGDLTGLARHAEGPSARVQPRPPGGQGAAVRRARHRASRASVRAARSARDRRVRRGPHARRGRQRRPARPPTSPSTSCAAGMPFRDAHARRRRARARSPPSGGVAARRARR